MNPAEAFKTLKWSVSHNIPGFLLFVPESHNHSVFN